jgi:hypothetical protein
MFDLDEYTETAVWHAATCVQWQATDATEEGNGYPPAMGEFHEDEHTEEVVKVIRVWVEDFIRANAYLLGRSKVSAEDAGHNFVLSAEGHGTGFWDRGYEDGSELHDAASVYGSFNAEFMLDDDGEVAWLMVDNTIIVDNNNTG